MSRIAVIAIGILLGLVGTAPSAYLFERALKKGRSVSVGAGIASILL